MIGQLDAVELSTGGCARPEAGRPRRRAAQLDIARAPLENNRAGRRGFISPNALRPRSTTRPAHANHEGRGSRGGARAQGARRPNPRRWRRSPTWCRSASPPGENASPVDGGIVEIVDLARVELELAGHAGRRGTVRARPSAPLRVDGMPAGRRAWPTSASTRTGSRSVLVYSPSTRPACAGPVRARPIAVELAALAVPGRGAHRSRRARTCCR